MSRRVASRDAPLPSHGHGSANAVLYLRVSTKEQAERGGESEGFSIPAQREACRTKTEALGAVVAHEFVDRGESARSAKRPELQRMLRFVRENDVRYVVVHKMDRLARNLHDHVTIVASLDDLGIDLVSCSENIDNTPTGKFMRTVMAGMAQFYSDNLATEVVKGLVQKAKTGGTVGKAPLGYLNVKHLENGREVRTVEVDPERAPLMTWAFEVYADGDWSLARLLDELTVRGLTTVATAKRPAQPLYLSHLHKLLRHPYYKGVVRYKGVEYRGKHRPLVSARTWELVQERLEAHNTAGVRQRTHDHYLKGVVFCGKRDKHGAVCGGRLIITHAKSRSGRVYPYFVCVNRHQKRNGCTFKAVLIDEVEERIVDHYALHQLSEEEQQALRSSLGEELEKMRGEAVTDRRIFERRQQQLERESRRLLQAHYADAIPFALFESEQRRIADGLRSIERELAVVNEERHLVADTLELALNLATDVQGTYRDAPNRIRRRMNQALFTRFVIEDGDAVAGELTEPFEALLNSELRRVASRPTDAQDTFEADLNAWAASWDEDRGGALVGASSRTTRRPPRGRVGLNKQRMVDLIGQLSNPSERLQAVLELAPTEKEPLQLGKTT